MRRQHLDNTIPFCVFQIYHTKEGEHHVATIGELATPHDKVDGF